MAKQFIITKREMEYKVVYDNYKVTLTPQKYGGCTKAGCELIARSYQVMA